MINQYLEGYNNHRSQEGLFCRRIGNTSAARSYLVPCHRIQSMRYIVDAIYIFINSQNLSCVVFSISIQIMKFHGCLSFSFSLFLSLSLSIFTSIKFNFQTISCSSIYLLSVSPSLYLTQIYAFNSIFSRFDLSSFSLFDLLFLYCTLFF